MCAECDKAFDRAQQEADQFLKMATSSVGNKKTAVAEAGHPPTPVIGTGEITAKIEVTQTKVLMWITDERTGNVTKHQFQYHPGYTSDFTELLDKDTKMAARKSGIYQMVSDLGGVLIQSCRSRD